MVPHPYSFRATQHTIMSDRMTSNNVVLLLGSTAVGYVLTEVLIEAKHHDFASSHPASGHTHPICKEGVVPIFDPTLHLRYHSFIHGDVHWQN
jgi:hypothetical protein